VADILLVNSWGTSPKASHIVTLHEKEDLVKTFPLSLFYLASALEKTDTIKILDPNLYRDFSVLKKDLARHARKADCIGFTTFQDTISADFELMNLCAMHNPKIFIGGWGSETINDYLKYSPAVVSMEGLHGEALSTVKELIPVLADSKVRRKPTKILKELPDEFMEFKHSEAKEKISEIKSSADEKNKKHEKNMKNEKLFTSISGFTEPVLICDSYFEGTGALSKIKGISYKCEDRIKTTAQRLPSKLKPFNADIKKFGTDYTSRSKGGWVDLHVILSAAGCPYSFKKEACQYCGIHYQISRKRSVLGSDFERFRKTANTPDFKRALTEINAMVRFCRKEKCEISSLSICDDSMQFNDFKKLAEELDKSGLKDLKIWFQTRPELLHREWLDYLNLTPKRFIACVGIEFSNDKDIETTMRAEDIGLYRKNSEQAIDFSVRNNLCVRYYVIFKATSVWENIKSNILGAIDLAKKGLVVYTTPFLFSNFSKIPDAKSDYYTPVEYFTGLRIPQQWGFKDCDEKESVKIYRGLEKIYGNESNFKNIEFQGNEIKANVKTLLDAVSSRIKELENP